MNRTWIAGLLLVVLCAQPVIAAEGSLYEDQRPLTELEARQQTYRLKRLKIEHEGSEWSVVKGINETIGDEILLQMIDDKARLDRLNQQRTWGMVLFGLGSVAGSIGGLIAAGTLPVQDSQRWTLGGGGVVLGGVLAMAGNLVHGEDRFLTLSEAQERIDAYNERLRNSLGLDSDLQIPVPPSNRN